MEHKDVPYIVYESALSRFERVVEKLWIAVILLIVLLVGSNAGWAYYESQFSDTVLTQEAEIDTQNGNAYVTNGGEITYGTSEGEAND